MNSINRRLPFATLVLAVAAAGAFHGPIAVADPQPMKVPDPQKIPQDPAPFPMRPDAKPDKDQAPSLADIVDLAAKLKTLATGLMFTEGPVWVPGGDNKAGYLLFSDIPADTIYRLEFAADTSNGHATKGDKPAPVEFMKPSGHSNGLTLDAKGRLLIAQHDGRVARRALDDSKPDKAAVETLAEKYDGKALNSPNDLIVAPDGSILFTDPPYGLREPLGPKDRKRELEYCGVYRLSPAGKLTLLTKELSAPNGLALSPDAKTLYVADTSNGQIRAFPVKADGTLGEGKVFATNDAGSAARRGRSRGADGIKVDERGNVYAVGPGGVWVYTDSGQLRGVIDTESSPTNLCFGGPDFKTLFVTTRDGVASIDVKIAGHRFDAE